MDLAESIADGRDSDRGAALPSPLSKVDPTGVRHEDESTK